MVAVERLRNIISWLLCAVGHVTNLQENQTVEASLAVRLGSCLAWDSMTTVLLQHMNW